MNNNTATNKTIEETGEANIRFRRTLETKPIGHPESEPATKADKPTPETTGTATGFKDVSWRPDENWESIREIADTILNLSSGAMVRSESDGIKNNDDAANELILFLDCLEKGNVYDNISALKDYFYTTTTNFREAQERYEKQLRAKLEK